MYRIPLRENVSEKLQQAISSIKSGNKQHGQQLLAQILQAEPNNETAWLWMSAVVDEDKRKYCIERVLKINPNNQAAKQALGNLNKIESKSPQSLPQQNFQNQPSVNKDIPSSKVIEETPTSTPAIRTILRDSVSIGIICGILEFPLAIIILFTSLIFPQYIILILLLVMQILSGIWTGINLLRKGIGGFRPLTMGGAISGFISGAILYLVGGIWFINNLSMYPYILTPTAYLFLCGFIMPSIFAVANAVTVWIPRIFINPKYQQPLPSLNSFNTTEKTKSKSVSTPIPKNSDTQQSVVLSNLDTESNQSQPVQSISSVYEANKIKFWINSDGKEITVFILDENEMISSEILNPSVLLQLKEKLSQGILPTDLLTNKIIVRYNHLEKVTKYLTSLEVGFDKSGQQESFNINCKDTESTSVIFDYIQKRLGTRFEKSAKTLGAGSFIALYSVFAVIVSGITAFLYYGALEIEAGATSSGSARTRGIINLLDLIGSSGVLWVGGIILFAALILLIYLIVKPPVIIELKLKNQLGIEKVKSIESVSPLQPNIPVVEFKEKPNTEVKASSNALIGAALSDGIMAGLIAGILSIPLPVISILTHREIYAQYGMYLDGFLLFFTGILTGILFYGRKIGGGGAIALGGAFGGAITGLISGLMLGYSQPDMFAETASSMNTDSITIYMTFCGLIPSITGAILGASTAWLPGIFMKSNEELESPSIEKITPSEEQIEKLDTVGARFKQRMKARFVVAAVSIGIVLTCSLCQALAN